MYNLELLAKAEWEMSDSYDFYESRQKGLGGRFFKEVDHYLELITRYPYNYQVRYAEELRAAALKIFPFLIIFWIDEPDQTVYITSIFNTSQKPQY